MSAHAAEMLSHSQQLLAVEIIRLREWVTDAEMRFIDLYEEERWRAAANLAGLLSDARAMMSRHYAMVIADVEFQRLLDAAAVAEKTAMQRKAELWRKRSRRS